MRGLSTTRFCGEKDARFRLRTRLSEADDEGVCDVIGVRGAAVVMRRNGEFDKSGVHLAANLRRSTSELRLTPSP